MFFSIASSIVMAGVAGYAFLQEKGPATNDADKMQKIFNNAGWNGKNGETFRLHRKTKFNGGVEYVYQPPLGFDRTKIEDNKHILEDGLNIRYSVLEFDKKELLKVRPGPNMVNEIKTILTKEKRERKEIELNFDGMLKIKVYNQVTPDRLEWHPDLLKLNNWAVPIGADRKGGIIYHDFDKRKHLIIAGATGGGKSVTMKGIITTLILQQADNVTFSLIDLKGGPAFARFKNTKQVVNFGTDTPEALEILKQVQNDMNDVYKNVLVPKGYEDITEAGIKGRHFIVIDEAADLADNKEAMGILTDIVRKGRGAGYYVIYATQYPSKEAISMQIKRNVPARLSFILDDATASKTVLDASGAELLPEIPGRGIYKNTKQNVIQAYYMSNKVIEENIKPHLVNRRVQHDHQASGQTTKDRKHTIEFEKV